MNPFIFTDIIDVLNDISDMDMNIYFKNQLCLLKYIKMTFPEITNLNKRNLFYKINMINPLINENHKHFIKRKIKILKYILSTYNKKFKKNVKLSFLKLFQIINRGEEKFKKKFLK